MFDGYTMSELGSIFAMQGFAGLILFSVFVLMALGLAIIFGQMGVINMAHGEFMILGAYVTYLCSNLFSTYLPGLFDIYFFIAMVLSFIAAGALVIFVPIYAGSQVFATGKAFNGFLGWDHYLGATIGFWPAVHSADKC